MTPRYLFNGVLTLTLLVALILIGRVLIAPDAGATLFARARQLEEAGQVTLALKHYALVAGRHPESSLAPRALLKEGELLSARGRQNKNTDNLRQAMNAYALLAQKYPDNPLANAALFDAGELAAQDLGDVASARRFYNEILKRNSDASDAAAIATTKLGRLALDEGNAKGALEVLQSVFARWPRNMEAGAEAQFHLGVLFETLLKDRGKAQRAYDATLARYPQSVWAGEARERLGLLAYDDQRGRRPARRVLLDIAPLPDDNGLRATQGKTLWDALRVLLNARGLSVDENVIRGWSLLPFWAGVDKNRPGRVVKPSFDAFENVVANAGLRYTIKGGGGAESALRDLQDDVDSAREPLVYIENGGEGEWTLCVGYDSERGEVLLQNRGARFDTLAVSSFAAMWKAQSKFGKPFTSLSFIGQNEKPRTLAQLSAQQTPTPGATNPGAPNAVVTPTTTAPQLDATPQFIWELPRLKAADAHARALKRASLLLNRNGSDTIALNVNGLDYLARELRRIADSPEPQLGAPPAPAFDEPPIRREELGELPAPTPSPTPPPPRDFAPRARGVVAFFGAPAQHWALLRRQAANYCQVAGAQSNRDLSEAIANFGLSADALDAARALAPQIGEALTPTDRAALREMARQVEIARDAERAAARGL